MFRSIGRWFRSLGYVITGRVDSSARRLDTDPHAMRAKYDDVIREKTKRIQQYKEAVAGLIAQQEQKMSQVKDFTDSLKHLEDLKSGALAKAQQRVGELQATGADDAAIKNDPDYQKCLAAFNDFSSTALEKQSRVDEAEHDIEDFGKRIKEHTLQLAELRKEIEKLRSEANEAVADVISAKQEAELNDALSGIGTDSTSEKLSELRRLRSEAKAGARVSKELAGTDHKLAEAEFLEDARKSAGNTEFERLVGLAKSSDAPASASPESASGEAPKREQLPE